MKKQSRLTTRKLAKIEGKMKTKKTIRHSRRSIWILVFLLFGTCLVFGIWHFVGWDSKSKVSFIVSRADTNASVVILDPASPSITTLTIPKETLVDAANQEGSWKLASIQKLGRDENLDGSFLKNTIIKTFRFPIDNWVGQSADAGESFMDLVSGSLPKKLQAIFKGSNLSLIDRLKIALFAISVGNSDRVDVKLADTSYLVRSKLPDASLGWKISTNSVPSSLQAYFVNPQIQNQNITVLINNKTGSSDALAIMEKPVEIIGATVALTQDQPLDDHLDCSVQGASKTVVTKIAGIFSCEKVITKASNNFDIEINIGARFTKRF